MHCSVSRRGKDDSQVAAEHTDDPHPPLHPPCLVSQIRAMMDGCHAREIMGYFCLLDRWQKVIHVATVVHIPGGVHVASGGSADKAIVLIHRLRFLIFGFMCIDPN